MKVFLRDHRVDPACSTAWQKTLERFDISFEIAGDQYDSDKAESYCAGDVVLLHSEGSNHRKWTEAINAGNIGADVIMVSTSKPYEKDDFYPLHSCYWLPNQFESMAVPRGFAMGLRIGEFRKELLQPSLFPSDNLALALAKHYGLSPDVTAKLEEPARLERKRLREPETDSDLPALRRLIERHYAPSS